MGPLQMQSSHTRAETILEVLVAVGILSIMLVLAGQLRVTAIRNAAESRAALIANEVANEGIEGIATIIGTNRLRFAGRSAECWDSYAAPGTTLNLANCNGSKLQAGSFVLGRDLSTLGWVLTSQSQTLSQVLPGPQSENLCRMRQSETYRVRLDQPDTLLQENPDCQYDTDRSAAIANQPGTDLYFQPARILDERRGTVTRFFRSIEIGRSADLLVAQKSIRVTSRVVYFLGNARREVVKSQTFHNKPLQ